MSTGAAPRAIAANVLDAVLYRGRSLKAELATALPPLLDPRDRALVEAICFAVLRQPMRFEAALAAFLSRPLPKRDAKVRALLLVGFAQLDPLGPARACRGRGDGRSRAHARPRTPGRPGQRPAAAGPARGPASRRSTRALADVVACATAARLGRSDRRDPRCQRYRAAVVVARQRAPRQSRRLRRAPARHRDRGCRRFRGARCVAARHAGAGRGAAGLRRGRGLGAGRLRAARGRRARAVAWRARARCLCRARRQGRAPA